ncbi:MAG TPA: LapA family protein [Kamptonema sp.]|nr:LapA family protein [Kamptonema sp.]
MKNIPNFSIAVVVAAWVSAIAIFSVQNAAPVSLNFLFFQSIEMPVGVVLALSGTLGIIGGAILQFLWVRPQVEVSRETKSDRY